jgi:hypothetical protein
MRHRFDLNSYVTALMTRVHANFPEYLPQNRQCLLAGLLVRI